MILAANGRCDSPGKSVKYCTYSPMDHETNKILHVETVDKCEVGLQLPDVKHETFTRSIAHIATSICALSRSNHRCIIINTEDNR